MNAKKIKYIVIPKTPNNAVTIFIIETTSKFRAQIHFKNFKKNVVRPKKHWNNEMTENIKTGEKSH